MSEVKAVRVLVTGCSGYIGSVLMPFLAEREFDVVGMDTGWYRDGTFGAPIESARVIHQDVRDVEPHQLEGFDVVMYLAALSNDPVGNLNPELTYEINHDATIRFARLAKQAGVTRFIFSSSCSLYGASGDGLVSEQGRIDPVTPYGETKALVDQKLGELACSSYSPVRLRNATAYGVSPKLRLDLVLNDLVASALTTGTILMKSDGTPWRPLVHVEDICRAFVAAALAPTEAIHDQAFNIGRSSENYRISELAEIVRVTVPGSRIEYAPGAGPDKRCYRVDFGKCERFLPGFRPRWNARLGAKELYEAFRAQGLTDFDATGPKYRRLGRLRELLTAGELNQQLRWQMQPGLIAGGE